MYNVVHALVDFEAGDSLQNATVKATTASPSMGSIMRGAMLHTNSLVVLF